LTRKVERELVEVEPATARQMDRIRFGDRLIRNVPLANDKQLIMHEEKVSGWNQLSSLVFGGAALLLMYTQHSAGANKKLAVD